jgi:hypothetical protein
MPNAEERRELEQEIENAAALVRARWLAMNAAETVARAGLIPASEMAWQTTAGTLYRELQEARESLAELDQKAADDDAAGAL